MTRSLQVKESKFKKKPGTANDNWFVFDLESDGLYDKVTKVFCIVLYDICREQTFTYGPDRIDDALAHLATADFLIGHNIINYDLAVLQKLAIHFDCKTHIIDTLICNQVDLA